MSESPLVPVEGPIVWTRPSLLKAAGFKPVPDVRRALRRTRQALNAKTPMRTIQRRDEVITEGGEADHRVRLEAASLIFELGDVRKMREEDRSDSTRPIAIALILDNGANAAARAALPTDGVRVHLTRGDGE